MNAAAPRAVDRTGLPLRIVPSTKKPMQDLDSQFWLSPGHPDILPCLTKARKPTMRISPLQFGDVIRTQGIKTVDALYTFAQQQQSTGDARWLSLSYQCPPKKLQEKISAVWAVVSAP